VVIPAVTATLLQGFYVFSAKVELLCYALYEARYVWFHFTDRPARRWLETGRQRSCPLSCRAFCYAPHESGEIWIHSTVSVLLIGSGRGLFALSPAGFFVEGQPSAVAKAMADKPVFLPRTHFSLKWCRSSVGARETQRFATAFNIFFFTSPIRARTLRFPVSGCSLVDRQGDACDFGEFPTGMSSLARVGNFPFHFLIFGGVFYAHPFAEM